MEKVLSHIVTLGSPEELTELIFGWLSICPEFRKVKVTKHKRTVAHRVQYQT